MAGHSKWNNIKRRKGAEDAKRAKIFTKLGREIQVAVREGGADPEFNAKLAAVIDRAKSANVPNDNIERSIKRGLGEGDGADIEEIIYEGYGPGGVAIMVRCLSDNRNRTAGDIRHLFDRNGGNLGTSGCVSFMFNTVGSFFIRPGDRDLDTLLDLILEGGADDLELVDTEDDEEIYEVTCEPQVYHQLSNYLKEHDVEIVESSLEPTPENYVTVDDPETAAKVETLIEDLEDSDDVQDVYTNFESDEDD